MRLSANCNRKYRAYHTSGTRLPSSIANVILHCTQSDERPGSARAVAQYFQEPSSGGSAHLVVDNWSCYRCLDNEDIPWGAPGANEHGFHIEQVGRVEWSRARWLLYTPMILRAAYKTAVHCVRFSIPPVLLTPAQLANGRKGIATHAIVTAAYPALAAKYGSHSDPGPNYPIDFYLKQVKRYVAKLEGSA